MNERPIYQFKLIAHATDRGSTPNKPNEDGFVVTPEICAMIDGATGITKNGRRFIPDERYGSDPQWLAAQIIDHLKHTPFLHSDLRDYVRDMAKAMKTAFEKIATTYQDTERIEVPSAALGIAGLYGDQLHITTLADVSTVIILKDGSHRIIPCKTHPDEPELNRRVVNYQNTHGVSFTEALAANIEYCREIRDKSNRPGCWGVVNTWDTPPDECFGPYESMKAGEVARIIQYTDGLDDRFGTFTVTDLIAAASSSTELAEIIAEIRAAENADANAKQVPRAKMSDDTTIAVSDIVPAP